MFIFKSYLPTRGLIWKVSFVKMVAMPNINIFFVYKSKNVCILFIIIFFIIVIIWSILISMTTLTHNSSTYQDPIYGSSRSVWKLLVFDRNNWNHIIVCKLFFFVIKDGYLKL